MKNGYTLIELIIVIVVLMIIGIILLPITLGKINESRYESAKEKAYNVLESVKLYHYNKVIENNGIFEEVKFVCNEKCMYLDYELDTKSRPSSGEINISNDGTITGKISFYDDDYVFYICNNAILDEKITLCAPSNTLTLKASDYQIDEKVMYAGFIWSVIKDNGDNTTLVLNNVISTASLGNKKYDFGLSDVNTKLNEWFNNNETLVSAKKEEKLVSMKFSDGEADYDSFIRIPTTNEAGVKRNLDKCMTPWCNIKKSYWLLDYQKSFEGIFKVYSIGDDGCAYSIDVSNEIGMESGTI